MIWLQLQGAMLSNQSLRMAVSDLLLVFQSGQAHDEESDNPQNLMFILVLTVWLLNYTIEKS